MAALIVALVLPTLLMHEGMCLLGPFLVAISLWRTFNERDPRFRFLWVGLSLWLIAGSLLALYFTLAPLNPLDRRGFVKGLVGLSFLHRDNRLNPPVMVALTGAVGMISICMRAESARRLLPLFAFGFLAAVAGLAPILSRGTFAPDLQSEARSWVVAVPLLLAVATAAHLAGILPVPRGAQPLLATIVIIAAVSNITWQVTATVRWNQFIHAVRSELATARGFIEYGAAFGPEVDNSPAAVSMLATGWTFPYLSIALAPGGKVRAVIGNPDEEALTPAGLPQAAELDYSEYVAARHYGKRSD